MRLSTIQNDPGYSPEGFSGVTVTVDGAEVANPVTANEEDGWVRCRLDRSEETVVRRGVVAVIRRPALARGAISRAGVDSIPIKAMQDEFLVKRAEDEIGTSQPAQPGQ